MGKPSHGSDIHESNHDVALIGGGYGKPEVLGIRDSVGERH